jgi:hypothetical protein
MARHGYLGEYDEGSERDEDREPGWAERERNFMFGERGRHADHWTSRLGPELDERYLSWREEHMRELDRDYEEYRRERELQFHRDFDSWRSQRHGNSPLQVGTIRTDPSAGASGTLELTEEAASPARTGQDSMATATLGTTTSRRGRR